MEAPCILKGLGAQLVSVQELILVEIHRYSRGKLFGVEICKTVKGYIYLLVIGCRSCCITILDCWHIYNLCFMWFVYVLVVSFAFWRLDKGTSMAKLIRILLLKMVGREIWKGKYILILAIGLDCLVIEPIDPIICGHGFHLHNSWTSHIKKEPLLVQSHMSNIIASS